jgi:sugar phosphate isomerase/epimerase
MSKRALGLFEGSTRVAIRGCARFGTDYLRKHPHRFPLIHVKDFAPVAKGEKVAAGRRVGTELGHGFIDYGPIFAAAKGAGLKYYFAEQEGAFDRMSELEAARVAYQDLHSM